VAVTDRASRRLARAVERLLAEGKVRTRDLGGRATTGAVVKRIIGLL